MRKWAWGSGRAARAGGGRSREDAALVGELCHRVLERWDYAVPGDLDALLARAGTALARRHPSASWDGLSAEAREILNGFFSTPAARELAGCEILGREGPFVFPPEGEG